MRPLTEEVRGLACAGRFPAALTACCFERRRPGAGKRRDEPPLPSPPSVETQPSPLSPPPSSPPPPFQETKAVFEKLHKYIGKNIRALVDVPGDDHVLRLHRDRVYYVRASLMKRATNVARDALVHLGTCVGKMTHSGKFRLTVGATDLLAQHAKYKVRGKGGGPGGENDGLCHGRADRVLRAGQRAKQEDGGKKALSYAFLTLTP